jgi:homoserine kinase
VPAPHAPIEIVVPGSTANLGSGFDTLGLALSLYLRARIVSIDAAAGAEDGELRFTFNGLTIGEHCEANAEQIREPWGGLRGLPQGENSIERALRAAAAKFGERSHPGAGFPSLHIDVRSDIPLKAGLGSSAAAIVAGIRIYEAIAGPLSQDDVLTLAGELEGHPDNTSASILGGLTASCQADGRVVAVSTPWPEQVRVLVATPAIGLATKVARAALPASVSRADAIFNRQRTAVLLQAIAAGRFEALREGLRDRLHQPYRAALVPGLERALTFEHPALLGVFLSGAGPSIAAFTLGDAPEVEAMFRALYADEVRVDCAVRTLRVHQPTSTPVLDARHLGVTL